MHRVNLSFHVGQTDENIKPTIVQVYEMRIDANKLRLTYQKMRKDKYIVPITETKMDECTWSRFAKNTFSTLIHMHNFFLTK